MTKHYKNCKVLPSEEYPEYPWRDKIVTLPGIKKTCIGYFYLLGMIELASQNPYASLQELYVIGTKENTFGTANNSKPLSYSSLYTGINYALKEVPDNYKPTTLKKYISKAAMDLLLLTGSEASKRT